MPSGTKKWHLTCGQYIHFPCVFLIVSSATMAPICLICGTEEKETTVRWGISFSYPDIVPPDFKLQFDIICKDSII